MDNNNAELVKTRIKIKEEIEKAIKYASTCNLYHIRHLIYLLRDNRIKMLTSEKVTEQADAIFPQLEDDTLKYALSLGIKYGNWKSDKPLVAEPAHYDSEGVFKLIETTRRINGLFEHEMLLSVYHINRENPHRIKFEIPNLTEKDIRIILRDYGVRIERFAISGKETTLQITELAVKVLKKFVGIDDIFVAGMSISIEDFCLGIIQLNVLLTNRFKDIDDKFSETGIENIYNTFPAMSIITRMMIFTDSELEADFDESFIKFIKKHCFEPESLNQEELRYHYISRNPFFRGKDFTIISPDLVFDSILDNLHYCLLENPITKDLYQKHCGNQFLTDVKEAAFEYGFTEIGREIELYEGKRKIGDIDLILHNPENKHTLLIECKGHKLPLDVQFRSEEGVVRQINRTKNWERMVLKRIEHLNGPNPGYKVEGDWDYLIVTLMPEPLAHDSSLMVLTINELRYWLKNPDKNKSFPELFDNMYIEHGVKFTEESIKSMLASEYFQAINMNL